MGEKPRINGEDNHGALRQRLRPASAILIGASMMLTLSMGLRQSLGIFLQPMTRDIHIIGVGFHARDRRCRTSPGDSCSRSPAR